MNLATKPAPQLSLELILEKNRKEAEELKAQAEAKLAENVRIEAEMQKILSEPPTPPSRLVAAYKDGETLRQMALETAQTDLPPLSQRMLAEREVLYAALAIVRSWKRRHKKTYAAQEKELSNAVERLTWEK